MDDTPIFPFPSTKITIFMDKKRQPKAVLSGRRELNYVKAVRIGIYDINLIPKSRIRALFAPIL